MHTCACRLSRATETELAYAAQPQLYVIHVRSVRFSLFYFMFDGLYGDRIELHMSFGLHDSNIEERYRLCSLIIYKPGAS